MIMERKLPRMTKYKIGRRYTPDEVLEAQETGHERFCVDYDLDPQSTYVLRLLPVRSFARTDTRCAMTNYESLNALHRVWVAIERGEELPPMIVDRDGVEDGRHRYNAWKGLGYTHVYAFVEDQTVRCIECKHLQYDGGSHEYPDECYGHYCDMQEGALDNDDEITEGMLKARRRCDCYEPLICIVCKKHFQAKFGGRSDDVCPACADEFYAGMCFVNLLEYVRDWMLREMNHDGYYLTVNGSERVYVHEDATPWDINNGQCEEFAHNVAKQEKDAEMIWLDDLEEDAPNHCVVKWHDKYYDAECTTGVPDYHQLPICQDKGKTRKQVLEEKLRESRVREETMGVNNGKRGGVPVVSRGPAPKRETVDASALAVQQAHDL